MSNVAGRLQLNSTTNRALNEPYFALFSSVFLKFKAQRPDDSKIPALYIHQEAQVSGYK